MAHGFLTPQDIAGESPIFGQVWNWLTKDRERKEKEDKERSGDLVKTLDDIQETIVKDVTQRTTPGQKMLRGNQPKGLLSSEQKALPSGQKALPPGGPRLPGSPDGPKKGGGITSLSGDGGLNTDTFFKRATTGVGADGSYLTNAQRREAFITSRQEAVKTAAATNAPAISPDSGSDIVAAVSKNTEAILGLVKTTKDQTVNDTKLSEKSSLFSEKLLSRQRSSAEEKSLEQGSDLSGFLTPVMNKLEKKSGGGQGGGGGGGGMLDVLDVAFDAYNLFGGKNRRGRGGPKSRPRLKGGNKTGAKPRIRAPRATGGGRIRAPKGGLPKGIRGGGPLSVLTAGLEFSGRMGSGQNVAQAGLGTAASVGGGIAGAKGGAAAGAAIGALFGGVGAVPGALIGGLLGGLGGSMLGGGIADAATGANNIPSGSGGMLSSGPLSGYLSMLHGTELTLSGNNAKETKNIGQALGEGMINASLGPLQPKVLQVAAKGMKYFYERMGGKDIFASIFEGLGDIFSNAASLLGSAFSSLLGGPANAATSGLGADYLTDGSVEGNKKAIFAAIKGGGFNDRAASNMLAQIEGESGFKMTREQSYKNTAAADIRRAMGNRAKPYTDAQLDSLKLDDKKFFEAMYGNDADMGNTSAGDGYNYRGRGFIQLTGKNNYKAVGDIIGEDLVGNPDLMLDPAIAAKATMGYYKMVGANNDNMSTMTGAYNAVYKGSPNRTDLDAKDRDRVATRSARANQFLTQIKSGALTPATAAATPGQGGKVVEYITGDRTSSGYRADHDGGNYHDHIAFDSKETRDAAAEWLKKKGWKIGSMNDGKHADGSFHYSDQAFDIPFYPNQTIKGVTDDDAGETELSSALRADLAAGGFTGSGIAPVPGATPQASGPLTAEKKAQMFEKAGMPVFAAAALSTPGPLSAISGEQTTGPQMLSTSQSVAMGGLFPTSATQQPVINNYYGSGNQQSGEVIGNNLDPGISMDGTGLGPFQDLRLRLQ